MPYMNSCLNSHQTSELDYPSCTFQLRVCGDLRRIGQFTTVAFYAGCMSMTNLFVLCLLKLNEH
ncbi:hypothetical protein PZA11_005432 [Diplocarpon coronariae]